MARNRVSYGVQAVFFGSPEGVTDISVTGVSGDNSDGYQVLSRLYRVQDFNYSFELPKELVSVLGRTSSVNSQLTAPPSVNVPPPPPCAEPESNPVPPLPAPPRPSSPVPAPPPPPAVITSSLS